MISDERIMGFVEGEGCFAIAFEKYTDYRPRKTSRKNITKNPLVFLVRPSFRISLADKDRKILELIRDRLGVGGIYSRKPAKNCLPGCQYYVQTFSDVFKVRDFFKDKEFLTTKGNDFRLWTGCLALIEKGEHSSPEGLLKICQIRDRMNPRGNKSFDTRNSEEIIRILHAEIANRTQK